MRSCLHLYTRTSKDSVFYQILKEDIELIENDKFEYDDRFYNILDSEAKKLFNQSGLKKGTYNVIGTKTESNEYWGEIRYLFLKPIK